MKNGKNPHNIRILTIINVALSIYFSFDIPTLEIPPKKNQSEKDKNQANKKNIPLF